MLSHCYRLRAFRARYRLARFEATHDFTCDFVDSD